MAMAEAYHSPVAFLCMCILAAMPVASSRADSSDASPLAFPGAQGHGRYSEGGRTGRILYVDNLKDHGPGSLRACAENKGPRNCVFRVSGVIKLTSSLLIRKDNGHLSILGQTAPGSGITVTIASCPSESQRSSSASLLRYGVSVSRRMSRTRETMSFAVIKDNAPEGYPRSGAS